MFQKMHRSAVRGLGKYERRVGREIQTLECLEHRFEEILGCTFLASVLHPSPNSCSLPFECGVPPTRGKGFPQATATMGSAMGLEMRRAMPHQFRSLVLLTNSII